MAATLSAARRQEEGKALTPTLHGLIGVVPEPGQPGGNEVAGRLLLPMVGDAIDAVMSRKQAASLCNISEPNLSRQLSAQDGKCLNFEKFDALGQQVHIEFAERVLAHYGINVAALRIQHAVNQVTKGLAMLVAEVSR